MKRMFLRHLTSLLLCGFAWSTMTAYGEDDTMPILRASVAYSSYLESGTMKYEGMYEIPTGASNTLTELKRGVVADGGGVAVGGRYYAVHQYGSSVITTSNMTVYDEETWEEVKPKTKIDPKYVATDVSLDPVTEEVYGCFYKTGVRADGFVLAKMDYENMVRTEIADLGSTFFLGVAIDRNGQMYAIDGDLVVYKVNKETGERERLGIIYSYDVDYASTACFDIEKGDLYFAVLNSNMASVLYKIDINNFSYQVVKQFKDDLQLVGMYIPYDLTDKSAPAAVNDFEVSFNGAELSGVATFTMPSTTHGGSTLTGNLTWHLLTDGTETATGTAQAGTSVQTPVTVTEGEHRFSIYTTNSSGDSPRVNLSVYAGTGTPKAPENATAIYDAETGNVTISWDASTVSGNGGYINPDEVRYTVTHLPSETIVAEKISGTQCVTTISNPALTINSYKITAIYLDNESDGAITPSFPSGAIIPPYTEDFHNIDINNLWTIINANNDEKKWTISNVGGYAQCEWNSTKAMDDWLITPAIYLEAGYCYEFSLSAESNASFPEKLEVKYGQQPTVEGMNTGLIGVTTIKGPDNTVSEYIYPQTSGLYYVGIHGCSDKDMMKLRVFDISIAAPISQATPIEVSELTVTPDQYGGTSAKVAFTLPETLSDGSQITSSNPLTEATVYVDDVLKATLNDNLTAGNAVECEITDLTEGAHTFTVYVSNKNGRGKGASATTFIGLNTPSAPANVVIKSTETPGVIHVTWDEVTKDADGFNLNPELLEYDIYTWQFPKYSPILTNVKGTSADITIMPNPDNQKVVDVAVMARNSAGESALTFSNSLLIGNAYTMPYYDSFNDGEFRPVFAEEHSSQDPLHGNDWYRYQDDPDGVASPYLDGWLAGMDCRQGEWSRLFTGMIKIEGEQPTLTFYTYNGPTDEPNTNMLKIQVREREGKWETLKTFEMYELGDEPGWHKVMQPLKDYVGKEIQIGFEGTISNYNYILIDNVSVSDLPQKDMALMKFTAPTHTRPGKDFTISTWVENFGMERADNVVVNLLDGTEIIDSVEIPHLESTQMQTIEFSVNLDSRDRDIHNYKTSIVFDGDGDLSNNDSETLETVLVKPSTPIVDNLTARADENGIQLQWAAPDIQNATGYENLEDFESYEAWATENVGDWTFIDKDYLPLIGFQSIRFPFGLKPQSWWVNDADWEYYTPGFSAHSGSKYIAQMSVVDDGYASYCDDFAISPRLDGSAQTVSFWVKRYSQKYKETFDFMTSFGEDLTRTVNFMVEKANISAPNEWTEMFFDVPEGTKYFAIRCTSYNALMMFVDDVIFKPANPEELEIIGYNIYRDGQLITESPVTTTSYSDSAIEETTTYDYTVTTVYRKIGESLHSNTVSATTLYAPAMSDLANVNITVDHRTVHATGCEGKEFMVTDASGLIYFLDNGKDSYDAQIATPGIYIVRCGSIIKKVVIK